ncbi:hypothetical protein WMY93_031579 [Mugilogobius chulae]|uniref:CxC3 like cysteine cluster domain-containing protein n=1 Tax=Mugilogobius chulae TaxID=88201 RepID=A0AAW0MLU8_9GOBI
MNLQRTEQQHSGSDHGPDSELPNPSLRTAREKRTYALSQAREKSYMRTYSAKKREKSVKDAALFLILVVPCLVLIMAFRRALRRTALVGGGAVVTVFGFSQLLEYRKKQTCYACAELGVHLPEYSFHLNANAMFVLSPALSFCSRPPQPGLARLAHVTAEADLKVPFASELPSRQAQLSALKTTEEFDVLIVGGGATGAGCALDAVTRTTAGAHPKKKAPSRQASQEKKKKTSSSDDTRQRLDKLLEQHGDTEEAVYSSTSWSDRQHVAQQQWHTARSENVELLLASGRVDNNTCDHCRYEMSLPRRQCHKCSLQWVPVIADIIRAGYWPATMQSHTLYQQDLFATFHAMKTSAPGLSRQSFTAMLDQRTEYYGRTGKVNSDSFQRSFLQYTYCQFEKDKLLGSDSFSCPGCTPGQLVVSLDGNRKLYRFRNESQSNDPGFFDGIFLERDDNVNEFVEKVRGSVKRLNMYRGEIYAYPMYLQREFCNAKYVALDVTCKYIPYLRKVAEKIPSLHPLTEMKACLSVMHAKAHNTKCEIKMSTRNQAGVGTTIGEEVEQVNSFLSRCGVTTKYMSKAVRTDMLTVHALGWNERKKSRLHQSLSSRYKKTLQDTEEAEAKLQSMQQELNCSEETLQLWVGQVQEWAASGMIIKKELEQSIETLFTSICAKKHLLYRQNDRNKTRQKITHKIATNKKILLQNIEQYNGLYSPTLNIEEVSHKLSTKCEDRMIWPWQEITDDVDLLTKKKMFDQHMLVSRLKEEKDIIIHEMMQHCVNMNDSVARVQALILAGQKPSGFSFLSEAAANGLLCILHCQLEDLKRKKEVIIATYKAVLHSDPGLWMDLEDSGEAMDCLHFRQESSSDSEDDQYIEVDKCLEDVTHHSKINPSVDPQAI